MIDFIAIIHYKTKYLKFFDLIEREDEETKKMTQFELFSEGLFVEDSIINSCIEGKFMAVFKCRHCSDLSYNEEDFLSLNFDIFKVGQSKHIRELRKNFKIETKDKPQGFLKVFSKEYWQDEIKYVTIHDYMSNL